MSPTFRSLRIRNYRLYWAGGLVSNVGLWIHSVAIDWLILQLSGSATALGFAVGLQLLPTLILTPIAGVVVDRFPKARILQASAFLFTVVAFATGYLAVSGATDLWLFYLLIAVFGAVSAFEAPARHTFVTEIVPREDLVNAVGLNSASINIARLVGPALAGLTIAALDGSAAAAGTVIWMSSGTHLVLFAALMRVDQATRNARFGAGAPERGRIRAGIRYARNQPEMKLVLSVVFLCGTFGLSFTMASALMATQVYGRGPGEFGVLASSMAVGSLAGALIAARRRRVDARFVIGAATAFALSMIIAGTLPSYLSFALWAPVIGLLTLTVLTAANATMQLLASDEYRSRVMALYLVLLLGGSPIGSPLLGWVGESFGARYVLVGGGASILLGIILAVAVFRLPKRG